MIDEFQRIESCRRPTREQINAALTSVFNRSPNFLSLILSFSGQPRSQRGRPHRNSRATSGRAPLPEWVSKDLADRIGLEKVMLLPPLTSADAQQFIRDIIAHYRMPSSLVLSPLFPFSQAAITTIIEAVSDKTELKPRSLMQFLNAVLEEADPLIEQGQITYIDEDFARDVINGRVYLEYDE